MVKVGKSKFDRNGRVSLIKDIADLMDLIEGDYIEYYIENGEVVIRKLTKLYPGGLDLEGEDIKMRLYEYEHQHRDRKPEEESDPETLMQLAREEYEKDLKARRSLKKH